MTVNFNHDLRVIPIQQQKRVNTDVLKKNINIPQFARLERKATNRAEEAKVETKKKQYTEAEKAPSNTEKATLETEEAKNYAEEAKKSAEKAKVILLKTKKDFEEAIVRAIEKKLV